MLNVSLGVAFRVFSVLLESQRILNRLFVALEKLFSRFVDFEEFHSPLGLRLLEHFTKIRHHNRYGCSKGLVNGTIRGCSGCQYNEASLF